MRGRWKKAAGGLALCLMMLSGGNTAKAAPVDAVTVDVSSAEGTIPPSVARRIRASISSIGNRVLVGKEESLFQLNAAEYDRVFSDIINRVVVGYVVSDLTIDYGRETAIHVTLQPVGRIIQSVETDIDYGNLSSEGRRLVEGDLSGVKAAMADLLTGLPVDSAGWADSVSQSAGRDLLAEALPEFQAGFEVDPGEHTKVRIILSPQGDIVRRGDVEFGKTTIPRVLMYRAVGEAEAAMKGLEGLPIAFVMRHQNDINAHMESLLRQDGFVKRYEIAVTAALYAGERTRLVVDALTDRWVIRGAAWLDAGRDGNKNTAVDAFLGRYWGKKNLLFGEARFYPGPVDWNVYGGWLHRIGETTSIGYKYDFIDDSGHIVGYQQFGGRWALRYDRDLAERNDEYALSYRVHNYMTVEYVYNEEDGKWLRLIANL